MASPPIPPSLDHLVTRPFSFYPPIVNVEHNEWLFRKASWSEILVVNCKTATEIWIPRRFVGEVSRVDDPVLIVGLNRELEYKSGMIVPFQRRVIEMPVAVGGPIPAGPADRPAPAPIVGIRTESPTDTRIVKFIFAAVAFAIVCYLVAVNLSRGRVVFTAKDQTVLGLTARDDRTGVAGKLGEPASDRWRSDSGTLQYEAMGYPDRHLTVILMGTDRHSMLYIGAMDDRWKPTASVSLRSGGTTDSLLRNLKRF
ncbi:MAG TPA: hypothetical protein VNY05_45965 [Candidatus Acidoferrales bacterium]|jgi:hypothetical protein|nr:hypothetical protein [Candidatus Acidoferrales bacterium]